eukprot:2096470-Heterocapsa_arctica.AAC.1
MHPALSSRRASRRGHWPSGRAAGRLPRERQVDQGPSQSVRSSANKVTANIPDGVCMASSEDEE